MELDAKILYDIALSKVLENEKKIIELAALYQQSLIKIKELEDEIYKKNEELEKFKELEAEIYESNN